mgnify:CR=1 FL=1
MSNITVFCLVCFFTLIVGVSSCDNQSTKESSMVYQHEPFPKDYYFKLSDKEISEFIEKQKKVALNDTVNRVKEILGEPTHDEILLDKKRKFVSRSLDYYLKKLNKNLVNEKHDMVVYFFFDENNQLKEVTSNIDDVVSRKRQ